jgi:cytochrome c556
MPRAFSGVRPSTAAIGQRGETVDQTSFCADRRVDPGRHLRRRVRTGSVLAAVALAAAVALQIPVRMSSCGAGEAMAHGKLPPGPISERHELMEETGKNAKTINDAAKSGQPGSIVGPARAIGAAAQRIPGLFPPGSTHPDSRAKATIWEKFPQFEQDAATLGTRATALADAAAGGADVSAEVQGLIRACKSCHDEFRVPKNGKD